MSTTKGQKNLASGNVFRWTHENAGGRGAITGGFQSEPTKADVEEAQIFARSLVPDGSRRVVDGVGDRAAAQIVRDAFIMPGVSRN